MTLRARLTDDLKTAMRSGDEVAKTTLRQLVAGIRQAELEQRTAQAKDRGRAKPLTEADLAALEQISLDEAGVVAVLQKEAKAIKESIADAERAGRADLVDANRASLLRALNNMSRYDLGGMELNFSATDHTGTNYADIAIIDPRGRFLR